MLTKKSRHYKFIHLPVMEHDTYTRSLLFDLFKLLHTIERSNKQGFFSPKWPIFLHVCTTFSELPAIYRYHGGEVLTLVN